MSLYVVFSLVCFDVDFFGSLFQDVRRSAAVSHGPLCPRGVRTTRTGRVAMSLSVFIPNHLLCIIIINFIIAFSHPDILKMPSFVLF